MRIRVTQECIDEGLPRQPGKCPIALAFRAIRGESVRVTRKYIYARKKCLLLPAAAQSFIDRFDAEKPVKPFAFTLKGAK